MLRKIEPRYPDGTFDRLFGGRDSLSHGEVIHWDIGERGKIRILCLHGAIPDHVRNTFANRCADHVVRECALGTSIDAWAQAWLDATDRTWLSAYRASIDATSGHSASAASAASCADSPYDTYALCCEAVSAFGQKACVEDNWSENVEKMCIRARRQEGERQWADMVELLKGVA